MNYSNITDKNGIIQREEALCLLGDTGISSNATLLKQFTAYNNEAYYEVWMAQLSVDKQWKRDDYNYTDTPDASITTVTSQADYTLPVATAGANMATFIRLGGVYYEDNGVRIYLRPMTPDETFTSIDNVPYAYRNDGKSLVFNCPLSAEFVSRYSVFHVEFQRSPDAFLSTDTTQQPGFMETYHDLIPLKASSMYLLPTNPQLSQLYEQRFLTRLELFKRDIAQMDDNAGRNFESELIQYR
jgi:hypothetical protein